MNTHHGELARMQDWRCRCSQGGQQILGIAVGTDLPENSSMVIDLTMEVDPEESQDIPTEGLLITGEVD